VFQRSATFQLERRRAGILVMASGFGPASAHANRSSTEYLGKAAVHILAINACASHNEDRSAMNFQAYQKWTITQETGLRARYWLRLGRHWEIMLLRQLYQPINQSNRDRMKQLE
jgi:hypothetical protein